MQKIAPVEAERCLGGKETNALIQTLCRFLWFPPRDPPRAREIIGVETAPEGPRRGLRCLRQTAPTECEELGRRTFVDAKAALTAQVNLLVHMATV